jgi:hypothetical protein
MAALSDYLESGLLSHIFRNTAFPRPSTIAIALTSGVPADSDTGSTIPELASGVRSGLDFVTTNYKRIVLGPPANSGDNTWNSVGVDATTAYSVSGVKASGTVGTNGVVTFSTQPEYGYFYPMFINEQAAKDYSTSKGGNGSAIIYTFAKEFPSVTFYAPSGNNIFQSGVTLKSNYPDYEGNGFIRNKNQMVFNSAFTEWGWVSGIAILDHETVGSGNLLMYAKLTNPRYVYLGDNIRFDANSLEISLK